MSKVKRGGRGAEGDGQAVIIIIYKSTDSKPKL